MSIERNKTYKIKVVVGCLLAFLFSMALLFSARVTEKRRQQTSDFSDGWRLESGEMQKADLIDTVTYGDHVRFSKTLPDNLTFKNSLCFVSYNSNFDIYIGDELAYSYHTGENFTGWGYGMAYHYVDLAPAYSGSEVTFEMVPVLENERGCRIGRISLEDSRTYQKRASRGHRIEFMTSIGIMVVGMILLLLCCFVAMGQNRKAAVALGVSMVINGFWLANDTGMFRLLTGEIMFCRRVDHGLMHLWIIPMMVLAYLITKERNRLYLWLIYAAAAVDIAAFLILRFAFGIDMVKLTPIMLVYYVAEAVICSVMLINNRRFCDRMEVQTGTKLMVSGFIVIGGTLIVDAGIYLGGARTGIERGAFSRIGFLAFFVLMLISLIRSWSREKATMRRNRFVNKMLQYAITTNDPEMCIRSIMEYVGTEFGADHVYIYENRHNGSFHNTYEWFRDEHCINPDLPDYSDLSDVGVIEEASKILAKEHRLVFEDVKLLKDSNPVFYKLLTSLYIKRMVVGPLEYGGELVGLFGVDDMPAEKCSDMADLIWLISYFVTQLLVQRNEKRNLVRYSYFDSLTGTRNRRGLEDFETTCDRVYPYGFLMCDINGLKAENDNHGHEAGDRLIIDIASSLTEVFGDANVFRVGGDEFAAYSFDADEAEFEEKVKRVRELFDEKHRSASIGYVFAKDPSISREEVKEQADALMYTEKERYYSGRRDRRR